MIYRLAEEIKQELIDIRRNLHRIPEIGTKEFKTSAYIKSKLTEFGVAYRECYNTGIVATINSEKTQKNILLRADIDALPLSEETGLEYRSQHSGIMHACGHDFHITCLLGAVKILNSLKDKINGRIVFAFQPDEENDGGALKMIEEGVAKGVDAAIALHIEPLAQTGTIQIRNGAIMASPDDFLLTIIGRGGHGACPEKCINPISIAAEIISEYHKIPDLFKDECVITVCSIIGGTESPNIIPDKVTLKGTARTLDSNVRSSVQEHLKSIAEKICTLYGADFDFKYNLLFPPLINNSNMNKIVQNAAEKLGMNVEILEKSSMTGDDFSYFSEIMPVSYFKLGTGSSKLGLYPLHSAKLNPDENALSSGTAVLVQSTIDYINGDDFI